VPFCLCGLFAHDLRDIGRPAPRALSNKQFLKSASHEDFTHRENGVTSPFVVVTRHPLTSFGAVMFSTSSVVILAFVHRGIDASDPIKNTGVLN
jgi:hypothetical protein